MATHLTRKELKQDAVALTVEHQIDWFAAHKQNVTRYGTIVVALGLVAGLTVYYRNYEHAARQHALAEALAVQTAPVGTTSPTGGLTFPDEATRTVAAEKAFTKVFTDYNGCLLYTSDAADE